MRKLFNYVGIGVGFILTLVVLFFVVRMGHTTTDTRIGSNCSNGVTMWCDKIVVEDFKDPKYPNVVLSITRAVRGGPTGTFKEDPSRFSLACISTAPVDVKDLQPSTDGEEIYTKSTSLVMKQLRVYRYYDKENHVLVYKAMSTYIIDGSPQNSNCMVLTTS